MHRAIAWRDRMGRDELASFAEVRLTRLSQTGSLTREDDRYGMYELRLRFRKSNIASGLFTVQNLPL